jgi:hypothetical protein
MVHLDIKKELTSSKWKVLPPSSKLQPQPKWEIKHAMCVWLKTLEVTSGFPSNLRSLVSMKDLTLTNYNSYDCHIMLTTFLPIAIKATKSVFLKMATMWSCYFFNEISQKVIDHDELELLKVFVVETLSWFEMCFPPSLFDMMVHLVVHLVPQIETLGPMYLHETWTHEHFMLILNGYVSNCAHSKGSMIVHLSLLVRGFNRHW